MVGGITTKALVASYISSNTSQYGSAPFNSCFRLGSNDSHLSMKMKSKFSMLHLNYSLMHSQKTQGFCVLDFATQSEEVAFKSCSTV